MEKIKDDGKRGAYGDAIRRQNLAMREALGLDERSDPASESTREEPKADKKPVE